MSNGYADRTHCGNGHEYTVENTYLRKDGGRSCKQCKRDRKLVAKNRWNVPMTALRYRDLCANGHRINEENLYLREGRPDECRACRRDSARKYLARKHPERHARLQPEGEVDVHKNDEKRSAPHNALGVKPVAESAWNALNEGMDSARTPCFTNRDAYIEFADPRYPDDPEEQAGAPFPSTAQAEAMCAGCPLAKICLEYALAQREDFGVWGGKRIVGGRVYRGQRKVVDNA